MRAFECLFHAVPVKRFVRLEHGRANAFKKFCAEKAFNHGGTRRDTDRNGTEANRARRRSFGVRRLVTAFAQATCRRRTTTRGNRRGAHAPSRVAGCALASGVGERTPVAETPSALVRPGFSAGARKTAPEGGCAPPSMAVAGCISASRRISACRPKKTMRSLPTMLHPDVKEPVPC